MELRLTFNEDALNYDKFRPSYAARMFDDVISFSSLNSSKKALEIGIGTGKATQPFLKTGCKLTAIEIGDKMAEFSRKRFENFNNLEIINQDFENVQLDEGSYDLIYSASAFHWIPPEIGLPKVYRLLKNNGVFAWISNQPIPAKEHEFIYGELKKVYEKYSQHIGENKQHLGHRQDAEEKLIERADALKQYGFIDIQSRTYPASRTIDADEYAGLVGTYSRHMAMPEEIRTPFLQEIRDTINHCGGKFTLSNAALLCMGRKP